MDTPPVVDADLLASFDDEARYRLLVDAVTDCAIYMLDTGGRVVSWNAGAQRLKGYVAGEIVGQHFSVFFAEEDRSAGLPQRLLATAIREGRCSAEGWRLRKDGTSFWAQEVIDAIRVSGGSIVGFAKVTRDLSDRKLAEESLKRSEEQFRLLVQSVTDYAIFMLDADGIVTNWNAGAQRIKGYLPADIIGTHFSRFYLPEDRAQGLPQRALTTAAREGRFESEGWRVRKDGTRFWANVVIDPIPDDAGVIVGFAKVTRDVTEKRAAQEALERAREALLQSQKLEAIGQLSGGIAHDFNNLLMVVLSSLDLARRRLPDDEKLKRLIGNAITGAKRGVSLTQRMLAFARRQELKPHSVDVQALVRGMTDMLEHALGPTIQIVTDFAAGLAPVLVDANQLELAILNLAVNARDAMPDGGELAITAKGETVAVGGGGPAPYVCLSIADCGFGMDKATLARAMEPFFTTKGVGRGTGLGLPMVHGLAAQSGGEFVLTSEPGIGTTAMLRLPVAGANALRPAPAPPSRDDAAADTRDGFVVLAVDDDSLVLTSTVAMLEELGHTALHAASGERALEVLRREPNVDLVVTDQVMPVMSGTQLLERVRREHPQMPAILATGYAELPSTLLPGVLRLAKPFAQEDLAKAVDAVMTARPG